MIYGYHFLTKKGQTYLQGHQFLTNLEGQTYLLGHQFLTDLEEPRKRLL